MAKKVEIKKTVFDRKGYRGVIDSKFKFFKELEPVVDPDTIEELFRLYDKLYALIPIEGEEQSHQYLVERSSELYKIDTQLESIQPLLDEVASLRGQILESNRRILELETQLAGGGELDFASAEQMELLRTQLETANATIATLEQANTLANRATEQATAAATAAATKAAEEAKQAAAAASAAAASEATTSTTPTTPPAVQDIINQFNKKRSQLYYAMKALEKPGYISINVFQRGRGSTGYYSRYGRRFFPWLYEDTGDDRYNGQYRYKLLADNTSEAGSITIEFVVTELEKGGYTAEEIVQAINLKKRFNGNVSVRVIKYKDEDREDKVGYRYTK